MIARLRAAVAQSVAASSWHPSAQDRTVAVLLARLGRFAWTPHNLIGHPLSELLYQLGAPGLAELVHDWTSPAHDQFEGGRG